MTSINTMRLGARLHSKSQRKELVIDSLAVVALIALTVFFAITSDVFLSQRNLTLLTGQVGVLLLSALGATLVIIMGSVDLSIGAIVLLSGIGTGKILSLASVSPVEIVGVALLVGAIAGAINGLIFAYGKVPSFIVTLGTLSFLSGLGLTIIDGQTVSFDRADIQALALGQLVPGIQNAALFGVAGLAIIYLLLSRTRFGAYIYALGGNERVVRLAGVNTSLYKTLAFTISGTTAGLSGVLLTAQLGSAGPGLGSTTLLDALAAIVIGGTSLSGGGGGVHRTLLGVLIITILANGLNLLGIADFTQTMIKGTVIVVAAIFTMASQRSLLIK
ncbi:ABC transporter permease [Rhizobium rhizogenes]|uniref:ABC transporter, membrane spanning protein n=1 Tax=Rhizobium rhizogenes (strain K84 / ATCC BAA-868) TaxID=311403 RepID=B9JPJ3_RHIR8|nr:ABC transporter, membrane spanning protein [Rhizobium rhizogenes K84]